MVLAAILALGLASGLCACHSGSGAPVPAPHFSLRVLEGTLADAPAGRYALREQPDGAGLLATLEAQGVQGLKALLVEVDFDPAQWQLAAAGPGPDFPPEALHLATPSAPGTVAYGQVLPHYDDRPGFSGSGAVAVLRFAPAGAAAFADIDKSVCTDTSGLTTPPLSWDPASNELTISVDWPGDYDGNGAVNIADITRVGLYFGLRGPFPAGSKAERADGDGNGEINLADLTVVGRNFHNVPTIYFARQWETVQAVYAGAASPETEAALHSALRRVEKSISAEAALRPGGAAPNGWAFCGNPSSTENGYVLPKPLGPPLRIGSQNLADQLPVALVSADQTSGPAPLSVQFDATATLDPDGSIDLYEWDWDGPDHGWFFEASAGPQANHSFESEDACVVTLRVRDNEGALAFRHIVINVWNTPQPLPAITLLRESSSVAVRRSVKVSAEALPGAPALDRCRWDVEGDGDFDQGYGTYNYLEYFEPGDYRPLVLAVSEEGAAALYETAIRVTQDSPPKVVLHASAHSGPAPLTVTFDISASQDDFGFGFNGIRSVYWYDDIVDYEGHTSSSGKYRDFPWQLPRVVQYPVAGTYRIGVEVVDAAGQSSRTEALLQVTGRELHTVQFTPAEETGSLDGEMIGGRPAVMYAEKMARSYPLADYWAIRFVRSLDTRGESWGQPASVLPDLGLHQPTCALLEVEGRPALAYVDGQSNELHYCIAADADGAAWTETRSLAKSVVSGHQNALSLRRIAGHPAIAWAGTRDPYYCRALDPLGLEWGEPRKIDSPREGCRSVSLAQLEQGPALAFLAIEGFHVYNYFVAASDAVGSAWNAPVEPAFSATYLSGEDVSVPSWILLVVLNGRPTLMNGPLLTQALDSAGSRWPPFAWHFGGSSSDDAAAVQIGSRISVIGFTAFGSGAAENLDPAQPFWPSSCALPDAGGGNGDVLDLGGYPGFFHGTQFSTLY